MADGAEGLEPLHTAALQGHADVVQMILDQGFDINTVVFKTKQSALHIASDRGHIQIVTLLTSRGICLARALLERFRLRARLTGSITLFALLLRFLLWLQVASTLICRMLTAVLLCILLCAKATSALRTPLWLHPAALK